MTLRKITIDNSVRYVKKSEQTRESKPNVIKNKKQSEQIQSISGSGRSSTRKNNSLPRKQDKNLPQNSKKFIKG